MHPLQSFLQPLVQGVLEFISNELAEFGHISITLLNIERPRRKEQQFACAPSDLEHFLGKSFDRCCGSRTHIDHCSIGLFSLHALHGSSDIIPNVNKIPALCAIPEECQWLSCQCLLKKYSGNETICGGSLSWSIDIEESQCDGPEAKLSMIRFEIFFACKFDDSVRQLRIDRALFSLGKFQRFSIHL